MIWENRDPFKKNKREALIKNMVLKRLGDEIRLSWCPVEESVCQSVRPIQFSNRPHYLPMFGRLFSITIFLSRPRYFYLIEYHWNVIQTPVWVVKMGVGFSQAIIKQS